MENNFWFNIEKYDFWPIYESIKKFYPLGIAAESFDEASLEFTYQGTKEKEDLIYENLFIHKNYKERWLKFRAFLKKELGRTVTGSIYADAPSFRGYINLSKTGTKDVEWTKQLHFAISLLGPYYTIYGLDSTGITLEGENILGDDISDKYHYYSAAQVITVSPVFEYTQPFLLLKQKITEWFPDYRLVPFEICNMKLKGLNSSAGSIDKPDNFIYSALFHSHVGIDLPVRGDSFYGYEEWLKKRESTEADRKNTELLERHKAQHRAQGNSTEVTVHKVWKYNSCNPLPQLPESGIGFLGLSIPFDILDLMDKKTLLSTNEESPWPVAAGYQLVENKLVIDKMNQNMIFKIINLTATELKLVINISINSKGNHFQGDILELVFGIFK